MKASIIKLTSLLLVFVMLFTALISCAADDSAESGSDSDSGLSSDFESGNLAGDEDIEYEFDENGTIPVFLNGAYTAKIIRGDMANALEKEIYNKIRELFKKKTGITPSEYKKTEAN